MSQLQKVKAVKDCSGHWYVIPNDSVDQFFQDDRLIESDDYTSEQLAEIENRWSKYMTGGDLNLIQLWAEI